MASDGKNLRLYQAVVDARKLLDELSDPETSVSGYTITIIAHEKKLLLIYPPLISSISISSNILIISFYLLMLTAQNNNTLLHQICLIYWKCDFVLH